jgi:gas vesicle protein
MANSNRFFEGLLVGGILGFLFGMLTAPKSGAELRRQLADQSDDIYRHASTQVSDIRERSEQALSDFQNKSETMLKQTKEQLQETRDQITSKLQDLQGKKVSVKDPDNNNT